MRLLTSFVFLLLLQVGPALAQDASLPTAPLDIRTQEATLHFTVEVATSSEQQHRGLMFRKSLPDLHGMIFTFPIAQEVAFWMKNTLIPLDMLFVGDNGIILHIAERTTPESLAPIPSQGKARAVIEVMGGTAAKYHIAPGDRVIYPVTP